MKHARQPLDRDSAARGRAVFASPGDADRAGAGRETGGRAYRYRARLPDPSPARTCPGSRSGAGGSSATRRSRRAPAGYAACAPRIPVRHAPLRDGREAERRSRPVPRQPPGSAIWIGPATPGRPAAMRPRDPLGGSTKPPGSLWLWHRRLRSGGPTSRRIVDGAKSCVCTAKGAYTACLTRGRPTTFLPSCPFHPLVISTGAARSAAQRRNLPPNGHEISPLRFAPVEMTRGGRRAGIRASVRRKGRSSARDKAPHPVRPGRTGRQRTGSRHDGEGRRSVAAPHQPADRQAVDIIPYRTA